MRIGLFIPCFMNELYPNICKATYKLLKNQGFEFIVITNQLSYQYIFDFTFPFVSC